MTRLPAFPETRSTVTLAPNDAETILVTGSIVDGMKTTERVRVTARNARAGYDVEPRDVFDVDVWRNGWTRVLTALDGNTADSIEEAAHTAFYVLNQSA